MVVKVLEFLLLDRLESIFVDGGLSHINLAAYRRGVSCAETIEGWKQTVYVPIQSAEGF